MGILDGIVEWIAEQVMAGLDLVTTSVLGALGCDMAVFLRYFPAAETMYSVFVALAIGIILLNWVWQLFKNFGLGAGVEAEDPVKLSIRSVIFILLTLFSDEIVNIVLTIGGTPYHWIMESDLPALSFADFNSVMLVIIGVCANGAVALITLILVLILAWNYLKLLFEAAERYVLLGVLVYTAPVAFSMGASQTTANIWKSWCRMLGGQIFLVSTFFCTMLRDVTADGLCITAVQIDSGLHNRKLFRDSQGSQFHAALGVAQTEPQFLIRQFQLQHFLIGLSGYLMAQKFERVKARHLVQFCHCRNCFVHHRHRITFFVHVGNSFLT